MSVTVTCKRIASAFRGHDGYLVYALHEVTYESNVYPHTKSISTVCVGDYRDCLKTIFRHAGATEGGGLNSPDRTMTPERYIKSWLNALKHPYLMDLNTPLSLSASYSWYKDRLDQLNDRIEKRGLPPTIGNYHRDIQELGAYFTVNHQFTDDGKPCFGAEQSKELAYCPKASAVASVIALEKTIFRIKGSIEDSFVIVDDNGNNMNRPEWAYSVMGSFITDLASREASFPGSYKVEIPAFRDRLENTPVTDNLLCFLKHEDDQCQSPRPEGRSLQRSAAAGAVVVTA